MRKQVLRKIVAAVLTVVVMFGIITIPADAKDLVSELFGISFYNFHFINEKGKETEETIYTWGSESEAEVGFSINKTDLSKIHITINGVGNETYMKCKPVLMWVHPGDALMDATRYTDLPLWYRNKLEETFLLMALPKDTYQIDMDLNVPMRLNLGLKGLINGGYYEIDFYSEDTIPEELLFAYEIQSYSIEELEYYIQYQMADNVNEYYNIDTGFRSDINGLPFRNSDFEGGNGICAGFANLVAAKYNKTDMFWSWSLESGKYGSPTNYLWNAYVYGEENMGDIVLADNDIINKNSPIKNMTSEYDAIAYPLQMFKRGDPSDLGLYNLLQSYLQKNNITVLTRGNSNIGGLTLNNLENRWSIIDYVASYMRQGKVVVANISSGNGGGHSMVGYRLQKIDDDTVRIYCYDPNYPNDMRLVYKDGAPQTDELNDDGSYKNIQWSKTEVYIDIDKSTINGYAGNFKQREFDVFSFDSSHTSFNSSTESGGSICFTIPKDNGEVGVFNYGSESNEVISYKGFPVIKDNGDVSIRTFAFYKSGEVVEITDSVNTNVQMDYNFAGWYKIKDSTLHLVKDGYTFAKTGETYVECKVSYDNYTNSYGTTRVRIPITYSGN